MVIARRSLRVPWATGLVVGALLLIPAVPAAAGSARVPGSSTSTSSHSAPGRRSARMTGEIGSNHDKPETTVVMPTRDNSATIGAQLAALAAQVAAPAWELVIVDNGSTDDTVAIARSWADRIGTLRVVPASERGCISYATNVGVNAAAADKILLCDADDVVAPTWVGNLSRGLEQFDIAGGQLEYDFLNDARIARSRPRHQVSDLVKWRGHQYAISANIGFRKDVFDTVGGFDESLCPAGFEEVVFALTAQRAGYEVGFVTDAVVHYRFRDSLRALLKQQYGYGRGEARAERCLFSPRPATVVRSVAGRGKALVGDLRALVDPERRWASLGGWAHLMGYAREVISRPGPAR